MYDIVCEASMKQLLRSHRSVHRHRIESVYSFSKEFGLIYHNMSQDNTSHKLWTLMPTFAQISIRLGYQVMTNANDSLGRN